VDRPIIHVGKPPGGFAGHLIKSLKPHQWVKNLLIFVPLITAYRRFDLSLMSRALIAFVTFCFAASGVYILNDLLDLETDRRHRSKRSRPIASGNVSIPLAGATAAAFLMLGIGLSLTLPVAFTGVIVLYVFLAMTYSFLLKRKPILDVICLATLYSLRIVAGGEAVGLLISPWLISFSAFFFLSLAFAKRDTELVQDPPIADGGYKLVDLDLIRVMGPACGLLSVLVLCLYINSPDVRSLHRRPDLPWLACALLLYWITRLWLFAYRGAFEGDPVLFALRDRTSYLVGFCVGVVLLMSI